MNEIEVSAHVSAINEAKSRRKKASRELSNALAEAKSKGTFSADLAAARLLRDECKVALEVAQLELDFAQRNLDDKVAFAKQTQDQGSQK